MNRLPLVARFQKRRWSYTRMSIHRMQKGERITFPMSELNNAKTSIQRLKDAYAGTRAWTCSILTGKVIVTRIK